MRRPSATGRTRGALGIVLAVAAVLVALVVRTAPAYADEHIVQLTRLMASRSDKTRLSAVLALAKLGDPRAEKPLTLALHDPSVRVRAVAATALGRLECTPALPTLRELATSDGDADVRTAASNAAMKIAKAAPHPDETTGREARRAQSNPPHSFAAQTDEPHPELYLLISSSADDAPGNGDKATRQHHAEIVKRALLDQLRHDTSVTAFADDARRWGLAARHIDVSITRLALTRSAGTAEVDAELRLTISDDSGKMLSFLSGGAKIQVPSSKFDASYLPELRKEALENAMRGMFDKLLAHLRDQTSA